MGQLVAVPQDAMSQGPSAGRLFGLVEWLLSVCLTSSSSDGLFGACSFQDPSEGASWKVERVGASSVRGSELAYSHFSLQAAGQGKSHD